MCVEFRKTTELWEGMLKAQLDWQLQRDYRTHSTIPWWITIADDILGSQYYGDDIVGSQYHGDDIVGSQYHVDDIEGRSSQYHFHHLQGIVGRWHHPPQYHDDDIEDGGDE